MALERCILPNAFCDCTECAMRFDRPWQRMRRDRYHTISPGVYPQFDIPNRLHGAAVNAEGDAI